MTSPEAAAPPPRKGFKRKTKFMLWMILIVPILLIILYTWSTLHWSYASGYRAGLLQKFSRKGYVCKTWEGEIQQAVVTGMAPVLWQFTVRDGATAAQLNGMLGQHVSLHYNQHIGIPTSCFGDTEYFVDSVSIVKSE